MNHILLEENLNDIIIKCQISKGKLNYMCELWITNCTVHLNQITLKLVSKSQKIERKQELSICP